MTTICKASFIFGVLFGNSFVADGLSCDDETCDSSEAARAPALLQKAKAASLTKLAEAPTLEYARRHGRTQVLVPELLENGTYVFPTKLLQMSKMQRRAKAHSNKGISSEMQEILDLHNVYRCMHGVELMTWDEDIAASAQAHADSGVYGHTTSEQRQLDGIGYVGENLAWGYPERTGLDSVKAWYDEIIHTDGTPDSCDDKNPGDDEEAICHYTQVVWKTSTKLGCGKGKATVGTYEGGDYWVCQYGPGGNYENQFRKNVVGPVKSAEECEQSGDGGSEGDGGESDVPFVEETQDPDCADGGPADNPIFRFNDGSVAECPDLSWFCRYPFVVAKCKLTCGGC